MRAVLLVASLVLVLVSCAPTAKAAEDGVHNALEMASYCKPVAESDFNDRGMVAFEHNHQTGICWGFFLAIQQATRLHFYGAAAPALYVCTPPESSLIQTVLVFRRYVEVNPSVGHKNAFFVARDALQEAFPCKG